ncbi:MAG: hypothetical protein HQK77_15055 [Desulfobacterales bacterium]|nr:hypothetical protein [Desulfobacterales bacterium]
MWVFTMDGFYSVVQKAYDKEQGTVTVRARCRADLEKMLGRVNESSEIIVSKNTDYRFRVSIPRHIWKLYLDMAAESLDYDNFKTASCSHSALRHNAYMTCWQAMREFQEYHHKTNRKKNNNDHYK